MKPDIKEIDKMIEVCYAPFKWLSEKTFEAEAIVKGNPKLHKFIQSNGHSVIHNTIYNMQERYEQEQSKLYEKFNIKQGSWYKLPEKERVECSILYHSKPILKMLYDFIGFAADENIRYSPVEDNPFALIIAAYTKIYSHEVHGFKFWDKKIEDYENKTGLFKI
jgi:hypothetical protein